MLTEDDNHVTLCENRALTLLMSPRLTSASARSSSRFDHLYKVTYDNVAAYLQKKQQRLEEQQLKRTKAQEANGSKKAKKSETS